MMEMVKNSPNPNAMIQYVLASNPEFKDVVNFIRSNGSPRSAFYALAKQKGADPNEIINMLK